MSAIRGKCGQRENDLELCIDFNVAGLSENNPATNLLCLESNRKK